MRNLELKSVEDFTSFLGFDPKEKLYQEFLAARNAGREADSSAIISAAGKIFERFIGAYFSEKVKSLSSFNKSTSVYVREGDGVDIYPPTTEIGIGNLEAESELTFLVPSDENIIKAYGNIKLRYSEFTDVLKDILLEVYKGGDGTESPRLGSDPEGKIKVASIEKIPVVIECLEGICKYNGEKKLSELAELRRSFREGVTKEYYNELIRFLAPANAPK